MIEHGIVVGGSVVPGTDWVRRDSLAWWDAGERGTRDRDGAIVDLSVWHWTAGHCRTGDTAAQHVVAAMKARKRDDGSPMDVGIHFVVGWDGLVWQTADLAIATVHVSDRRVIRRSIGIETCSPGTASQARKLGIPGPYTTTIMLGRKHVLMPPSEAMIAAVQRLGQTLADLPASCGVRIPMRVPLFGAARRFTGPEQRRWTGAQEHLHVPTTRKIDGGGLLVGALADVGWRRE